MIQKVKKAINKLFKDIWGENPLTFYFSFDGRFNQLQLWGALITINLFCEVIDAQNIGALTAIASFVAFWATLAGIQKRCRDLNHKGTIITLVYTGAFLLTDYYDHITLPKVLEYVWGGFVLVYIFAILLLLFFPGRKEKKPDIVSSLLKRPYLYIGICAILFLLGRGVMFYLGA